MPQIVCVVGPTASGKTKMGVQLAKEFHGEVVSVDSMQIYRGMAIGTAAPTEQETEGIVHHMVGIADPGENWSVARFVEEADRCIRDILERGKLPILVGGTGLYLDALVRGTEFAPGDQSGEIRNHLQKRMETEGIDSLFSELRQIDPEAAEKLHEKDVKRIIRALEVYYETGETITVHNDKTKQVPPKYQAIYIGLDYENRQDLRDRIDIRVDQMVQQGLLEEVKSLLNSGLPREATAMQAIGYKQFLSVMDGEISVEDAVEEVKLRSRQYAKRQLTWLRKNHDIFWIHWGKEPDFALAKQQAVEYINRKINTGTAKEST